MPLTDQPARSTPRLGSTLTVVAPEPAALTDAVLLSVLLGEPSRPAADLAIRLVDRFGSVGGVLVADAGELRRLGAGERQVVFTRCLREAAVRLAREGAARRPVISSWTQLLAYVRTTIAHLPREQFRALYLDKRNILIREEWVADDPTVQAAVDIRIERLLDATAARIVAGQARDGSAEPPTDSERR